MLNSTSIGLDWELPDSVMDDIVDHYLVMKDTYDGCVAMALSSDSNAPETPTANAIIPVVCRSMAADTVADMSLDLPSFVQVT